MPVIKEIRASSARCTVKVTLGTDDLSRVVAVDVVLDRKHPDVIEAFSAIESLALRTAQASVQQATTRVDIDKAADAKAKRLIEAERKRAGGRAVTALRGLRETLLRTALPRVEEPETIRRALLVKVDEAVQEQERTLERKVG